MVDAGAVPKIPTGVTWHSLQPREERWVRLGQRPVIAWLTGLSGAGKSTIAVAADRTLVANGRHSAVLDGDNLRHGLNADLTFTHADRSENVRRTAEVARLMAESGSVVIVSLISPYRADRAVARRIAGDIPFLEVFVDTPLGLCEARDQKGLYRLARAGRIPGFTGVSAPYEAPESPDLTIATEDCSTEACAYRLSTLLLRLSRGGEAAAQRR
ncbi:adenylyl-sulfate kinase [Methylobacterium mesophilicum SR1.6/6]|uniref:Adenylyl-sulfate kinase n=1 Tax=Methylobacterium mesophilicum SR1.6/6 TaxID=908290 RepID=A0A6B9FTJ1_9HYPH|nr:adenylyl-sulfate kinase [Methylobacterium mesophilicum]QGY05066.1 adenylyl-sulfate kinase [Methylobacterium mesophilicum SR1.6/6]